MFLVDENASRSLVTDLRTAGYVADHIVAVGLRGQDDAIVFAYAQAHGAVLITGDLDFANITRYRPPHAGIMVLRIPDTASTMVLSREVLNALSALRGQSLKDSLIIVEPGRVRRRGPM